MTPKKLKRWRTELGYTKREMAAALGCSVDHYARLENGVLPLTKDRSALWSILYDRYLEKDS